MGVRWARRTNGERPSIHGPGWTRLRIRHDRGVGTQPIRRPTVLLGRVSALMTALVLLVAAHPAGAATPERWVPRPTDTFQYQLSGAIDLSVDADVFDIDAFETSASVVRAIHERGRRAICYLHDTGFRITRSHQLRFDRWLAWLAHDRGLSVGLKNSGPLVTRLVDRFDLVVTEECFQYRECGPHRPFRTAGKAHFDVEYTLRTSEFCDPARTAHIVAIRKRLALDPWRRAC